MAGRDSYLCRNAEEGTDLSDGLGKQSYQELQEVGKDGKGEGSRMHDDASESGCGLGYGSFGRGAERRI